MAAASSLTSCCKHASETSVSIPGSGAYIQRVVNSGPRVSWQFDQSSKSTVYTAVYDTSVRENSKVLSAPLLQINELRHQLHVAKHASVGIWPRHLGRDNNFSS